MEAIRTNLMRSEIELEERRGEVARDEAAQAARENASWKSLAAIFAEGKAKSLTPRLIQYEPLNAAKILRAPARGSGRGAAAGDPSRSLCGVHGGLSQGHRSRKQPSPASEKPNRGREARSRGPPASPDGGSSAHRERPITTTALCAPAPSAGPTPHGHQYSDRCRPGGHARGRRHGGRSRRRRHLHPYPLDGPS